ncbi:hypothetical protein [Christensenella tenuis]|uniref:Lipoprotein n=1 Tax=Christensenella tenuis TaxID=2763033 RepID=A0ABR7EB05_9FIRM|nr:hypothetical protein [Christensenella tenuis]MBC5646968.1 hypothetical protein [Christensenella tenuis]
MKKKLIVLLVIVIAAVTVLAGCGGAQEIKRPEADGTKFEVTGSCTAELTDGKLIVSGETNLMDGTNGIISVLNSDGTRIDQQKITKEGNNLKAEFTVKEDWPETVYGFVMFDTSKSDGQPEAVKQAYGKKFQNLEGEDLIWDKNGVIVVFQSEAVKVK